KFRDGMPVTGEAVSLILASIDRIKEILAGLEATQTEPEGSDEDLIVKLHEMVEHGMAAMASGAALAPAAAAPAPVAAPAVTEGTLVVQTLERELRPGEVSLDELERAFQETAIEAPAPSVVPAAAPEAEPAPVVSGPNKQKAAAKKSRGRGEVPEGDKTPTQAIRANVHPLEHLMTMVS